jgi:hypothetical protein
MMPIPGPKSRSAVRPGHPPYAAPLPEAGPPPGSRPASADEARLPAWKIMVRLMVLSIGTSLALGLVLIAALIALAATAWTVL